jgi:hypothetical protein
VETSEITGGEDIHGLAEFLMNNKRLSLFAYTALSMQRGEVPKTDQGVDYR